MLRVLLDDRNFSREDVPHFIFSTFALATLTVGGGVRGIAKAHRSGGPSPKRWPSSSWGEANSSLHCPHERALIVLGM